jgi:purine-binding chemotaxis protein CheW
MSELHVVFKVGAAEYVLPAESVIQMESYTGATPVPGTRPDVAGLVQVRGKVVPVIDARVRFGLPAVDRGVDGRILVGRVGDRTVALIVDSSREVMNLAPEDLKPPPAAVEAQSRGFVKAVAQAGARLVMLLDLEKVVGEENVDVR